MVKIYVDERERASKVPKHLLALGVTVIYKQLEVGDYLLPRNFIVERKRIDDLAHSVFQGRFFHQLRKLKPFEGRVIVLVEGDLSWLRKVTDRAWAVESALLTAILNNDIKTVFTRDSLHTAKVLKYLGEKLLKERGEEPHHPPTYRKGIKPKKPSLRDWQIFVLSSLPGIGPRTAERLLEKFGSLREVLNATPYELSRVEGITEDKARLIREIAVHGEEDLKKTSLESFMAGSNSGGKQHGNKSKDP